MDFREIQSGEVGDGLCEMKEVRFKACKVPQYTATHLIGDNTEQVLLAFFSFSSRSYERVIPFAQGDKPIRLWRETRFLCRQVNCAQSDVSLIVERSDPHTDVGLD